jgi:hypothetical protein
LLLISACAAAPDGGPQSPATASAPPARQSCAAVRRAVGFLATQYDPAARLLREAPDSAPDVHWLATDNVLALAALRKAQPCAPQAAALAANIAAGLDAYDSAPHGLVEAVIGGAASVWPPHTATQLEVAPGVRREDRLAGSVMEDWRQYADLSFYGVLHLAQAGELAAARALYAETLALFDGVGFADKAYKADKAYASYKLALALLAAGAIGEAPPAGLLDALLARQNEAGGFFALYRPERGINDPNSETTAYSILALMASGR